MFYINSVHSNYLPTREIGLLKSQQSEEVDVAYDNIKDMNVVKTTC